MTDTNITLEEIAEQHMNVGMFMNMDMSCLLSFLSDPAILAHIPAYAEQQETLEGYRDGAAESAERTNALRGRIADLQSQLAALQAREPVAWMSKTGGLLTAFSKQYFEREGNDEQKDIAARHNTPLVTQAPASVQPAIAGKVPDGYLDDFNVFFPEKIKGYNLRPIWFATPISAIPPGYAVVPEGWKKRRMANHPHSPGMRLVGWVIAEDEFPDLPMGMVSETIARILASAPAIQTQAAAPLGENKE